jgi:hypothetical protein
MFKRYLDESLGVPAQDVVTDIYVNNVAAERIGYPTQKPLELLERIVEASSNRGDVVLDPFCGCGTAVDAAQKLGRRWIGIDVARVAVETIRDRMNAAYPDVHFAISGIPRTMDEVDFLADLDKYAFQQWACDMLGIQADIRKGADHGIDGEKVQYNVDGSVVRSIVSVKGGGVNVTQIRDLRGTVEREDAQIGIFITRLPPTKPMRDEAIAAGLTDSGVPKLQILTAADLIEGKLPLLPIAPQIGRRSDDIATETAQTRRRG